MKFSVEVTRLKDGRVGIFIDGGYLFISEKQMDELRDKLNEMESPASAMPPNPFFTRP